MNLARYSLFFRRGKVNGTLDTIAHRGAHNTNLRKLFGQTLAWVLVYGALRVAVLTTVSAQPTSPQFLSYVQAAPVFTALGEPLPSAAEWPRWIAAADADTRARVAEGDEISVVNLLCSAHRSHVSPA